METLSLLTLWQTDEEEEQEDYFFDIDFTVPIKRKNNLTNKNKIAPKQDILEEVPIFTLFTSEKSSNTQQPKRFSNNVVIRRYMKMIKPFYNKASKFKFSDEVSTNEKKSPLREVCRQLRKSRSASSGVGDVAMKRERRDDSLLQRHDGIQSAILHCRRSYYSSRDPPRTFMEEEQRRISI